MGGRGSYSYGGGTGATDTKAGKGLIAAGGGNGGPLPPENSSEDLQIKYERIGFEKVYGGDNVQNAVLGSYADQLRRLERQFGAVSGSKDSNVIVVNAKSSSAIAAVGFNPLNPADQTLYLNASYLGKISAAAATAAENNKSGWSAANRGDLSANAYYAVTHEYGHMLHNTMYAKAKSSGYTGSREQFISKANKEIEKIAKTRYGAKSKTDVSRYGKTNSREKFAETFASSQLGGNTAMAKAMRQWLKDQGF